MVHLEDRGRSMYSRLFLFQFSLSAINFQEFGQVFRHGSLINHSLDTVTTRHIVVCPLLVPTYLAASTTAVYWSYFLNRHHHSFFFKALFFCLALLMFRSPTIDPMHDVAPEWKKEENVFSLTVVIFLFHSNFSSPLFFICWPNAYRRNEKSEKMSTLCADILEFTSLLKWHVVKGGTIQFWGGKPTKSFFSPFLFLAKQ